MAETAEKNSWLTSGAALTAAQRIVLSDEAKPLLLPEHSPRQFVTILAKLGLGADAARFIPWCLTRREMVWWAAQCVRMVPAIIGEYMSAAAIAAAEKWVCSPTDENRRAALSAAEMVQIATPAGCVAMAVFFCDGSLAPPKLEAVPPPPEIAPNMAGNAVMLAAVCVQPEKALEKYSRFIVLADEVAMGTNRWVPAEPQAPGNPLPRPEEAKPGSRSVPQNLKSPSYKR